ncbi:hypothetical protein A1O1_06451 [Capronia coronata CBS 617.96]|uniref:JmjC domain-containing protein n=1 Tax=Capronia coronata CBS 617.96 TaxID=1182541 RepID=W9XZU3_9EURO|nr:uncharacterized protein A1O1_06451 [Capronia coronata CBS 617.96]EXJ86082.1 hypothetical protein A1O1_06451 [Capronia coronata CBS 617.96]
MRCLAHRPRGISALTCSAAISHYIRNQTRHLGSSPILNNPLQQIPLLPSWDADIFQERAYLPAFPARLPRSTTSLPPACQKWFIHNGDPDFNLITSTTSQNDRDGLLAEIQVPRSSELRSSFWIEHGTTIVPLELTLNGPTTSSSIVNINDVESGPSTNLGDNANGNTNNIDGGTGTNTNNTHESFHRIEAPLNLLLTYLSSPSPSTNTKAAINTSAVPKGNNTKPPSLDQQSSLSPSHSIYLAQCEISSLPASLQEHIPTPSLLTNPNPNLNSKRGSSTPIKGDIYSTSLWLGRPPTYTPLHRDPNPNLFVQLAGRKVMRLLPPEIGNAVFADVQNQIIIASSSSPSSPSSSSASTSSAIRGEEMMAGPEKELLHDAVWSDTDTGPDTQNRYAHVLKTYGFEVELGLGEGLFIPKGWWHSVKGVGEGVTASVNWWFR